MKIVLLTGKANVGKDTYARSLKHDSLNVESLAFADYLKRISRMVGWNGVKDLKGRTLLQRLGDVVNEYDIEFWSRYVCYQINDLHERSRVDEFIITDLRYDHEYEVIKREFPNAEITVIKLEREFDSPLTEEQKSHPSELGISEEYINLTVKL